MQDSETEKLHQKLLEEKFVYLKELNSKPLDAWRPEAEQDGIKVHSILDEKTGLKIIRAHTFFKAPAEVMVEVASEIEVILEWDKTLETVRALRRSKDNKTDYYIIYMITKKIPFIVQREAIILARFFYDDDGTIYGVGTSIDQHPEIEDSIYRVRAAAYLIGWVMKPDPADPERTELTYILNIDPKGWIPKPAFNWFVHNQGFNVKPFAEYVENRHKKNKLKAGGKKGEKPRLKQPIERQKDEEEILSPAGKL